MAKKCVYCKVELDDSVVVDVCRRCGIGVWGENMFNAIVQNMESARDAGDLYQGSVTGQAKKPPVQQIKRELSFVSEAKQTLEEQNNDQTQSQEQPKKQPAQEQSSFAAAEILDESAKIF